MAAIRWTANLPTPEAKAEFELRITNSADVLQRMGQIVKEDLRASLASTRREDAYNMPNWAYFQADQVGYQRALHRILELIGENNG